MFPIKKSSSFAHVPNQGKLDLSTYSMRGWRKAKQWIHGFCSLGPDHATYLTSGIQGTLLAYKRAENVDNTNPPDRDPCNLDLLLTLLTLKLAWA